MSRTSLRSRSILPATAHRCRRRRPPSRVRLDLARGHLVGGRGAGGHHRRQQAERDQASGPAVEGADQQHHAAQPEGDGGVGRVGNRPTGQVDGAEDADGQGGERHGPPEQDGSAPPGVARGQGGGTPTGAPGCVAVPGTSRRASGASGPAGPGSESPRTLTMASAIRPDDGQRPREPPAAQRVAETAQRRDRADDDQGDGPAALVEASFASSCPPRARAASRRRRSGCRRRRRRPAPRGHPHDHRVDVEVTGDAAGHAGDLAVVGLRRSRPRSRTSSRVTRGPLVRAGVPAGPRRVLGRGLGRVWCVMSSRLWCRGAPHHRGGPWSCGVPRRVAPQGPTGVRPHGCAPSLCDD